MRLSRLFNTCMIGLLLMVVLLLVRIQLTMVRDSIHDQMAANLETASTSLGLVLQGAVLSEDTVMAETIVNAMFDGGYVKSIRLVDPDGKVLFQREFANDQASAPGWLVRLLDFPRTDLSREITDGWNILGTLYIEGHRGYAYAYLWRAVQSQLWIMGVGLPLAIVLMALLSHLLLRPLRRAITRIAILSLNHLPTPLPGSAISDLDELAQSVNQLIQEKNRNYQRRKLKLLRWRYALTGQAPLTAASYPVAPYRFVSTQGEILLYQRVPIPWPLLLSWRESPASEAEKVWLEFQHLWPMALAEPALVLPVPLILLEDPWWPKLRELIATRRHARLQLEWQLTPAALPESAIARLAELGKQGITHHLGNFTANKQGFALLEKVQPQWVITPWIKELPSTYWILHNVTIHDLGAGVLAEGVAERPLLLELEFNGYPQAGASHETTH
ncbi:MAG: LapD/MoxY N-terminal periplasmic domain-containing protein [Aeromonadaceae bacterium]